jgi:hypothetical protein
MYLYINLSFGFRTAEDIFNKLVPRHYLRRVQEELSGFESVLHETMLAFNFQISLKGKQV